MDSNQRTCPVCSDTVTHKNDKDAVKAGAGATPCARCKYKTRRPPAQLTCPTCGFQTKRKTTFSDHQVEVHNLSVQATWDLTNGGPMTCACGCGTVTGFIDWSRGYNRVIVGHNANLKAVYGDDKAKEISDKRRAKLVGQPGWAKGLTKDTDERIAARAEATSVGRRRAFKDGRIVAWSKGMTKDTDPRLAQQATTTAARFASGELVPWAKGLTKDTDGRIATMALKVSMTHLNRGLRDRLDEIKRLRFDEVKARIENDSTLTVVGIDGSYINDAQQNIVVRCNSCNTTFNGSLRRLQQGKCYTCDPGGSRAQHAIASWIGSLGISVESNCRNIISPLELDVYVSHRKFAIEYNGLYWHNINQKSSIYHQAKTDRCTAEGITLFHVFEDEWRDRRPIVESMIRHRLGLSSRKVAARKCTLRRLGVAERQSFFNTNHIDGDTNAKLAVGLFLGNELIGAISLRVPFHKKHAATLEVARMCGRLDTSVQGGLSRLTKAAATEAKALGFEAMLTYVDTRFGGTGTWQQAGWILTSETTPRFWWTNDVDRFNRFKYRADKKNGLTEEQVASAAGVTRIYGCKNLCYRFDC